MSDNGKRALFNVYAEIMDGGRGGTNFNQCNVVTIPKGEDKEGYMVGSRKASETRPIFIRNTDQKICEKAGFTPFRSRFPSGPTVPSGALFLAGKLSIVWLLWIPLCVWPPLCPGSSPFLFVLI